MSNINKIQSQKILASYGIDVLQKSETEELIDIVENLTDLQKSEDADLQKGLSQKIHKYISKIGDKYIYSNSNSTKSVSEHLEYLKDKNHLDRLHNFVGNGGASEINRNSYDQYLDRSEKFKQKYNHEHDSSDSEKSVTEAKDSLHQLVDDKLKEIEYKAKKQADSMYVNLLKEEHNKATNELNEYKTNSPEKYQGIIQELSLKEQKLRSRFETETEYFALKYN